LKPILTLDSLPIGWQNAMAPLFHSDELSPLREFLESERKKDAQIFPDPDFWFEALKRTSPASVKAVILGQDPYHGAGQAHGLSFSVPRGMKLPPSLVNIFKEYQDDLGLTAPQHGDLSSWADQGVLLLNSVLSVRNASPLSHANQGWELVSDKILQIVNQSRQPCAFILWGGYAQKKANLITNSAHLILRAPHPSPLSVYRGFYGSKPFSKTNQFLHSRGISEIDWKL